MCTLPPSIVAATNVDLRVGNLLVGGCTNPEYGCVCYASALSGRGYTTTARRSPTIPIPAMQTIRAGLELVG